MTASGPAGDVDVVLLDDDAERLYDHAPCGYLSLTPDGVVVRVNQTFLDWTGLTRDSLVGRRRFAELLGVGGRIYHETHVAPMLLMQGAVRELALDVVRADGALLPVLVNAVLERGSDGRPVVVRVAMFDATERRGYERELLRARRAAEEAEARAVALARTLQQTLIPPHPPSVPALDLAAAYRPAGDGSEVGGDFYDVFQVSDTGWAVVLGDVAGKGVDAAILTSLIRYSVRGIAARVGDPSEVLRQLNEVLREHETTRFCTLVLLRLERVESGWRVDLSLGGHAPPLLCRAGEQPEPVGVHGSLVGIFDEVEFTTTRFLLAPGDALLLYTDGVTDAQGADEMGTDEMFGLERLLSRFGELGPDPEEVTRGLLSGLLAFSDDLTRDDIALLALRAPLEDKEG